MPKIPKDFIRNRIANDLENKRCTTICTRFPPEPNGYLHIGHAKSIYLNFDIADQYGGLCNLRFDDSNPDKESQEYVDAIKADVRWLGFDWQDRLFFVSDYYQQLYDYAVLLIKAGLAYVESLSAEEVREYRGTLTSSGKESPDRNRSIEENLCLFEGMKAGEFEDGRYILRAKIDMTAANMNLRDPAIYRIKRSFHYRSVDNWCIYPMYDFAHCISDAIEGITHSLCTLEFEDHRPLYDWFLKQLPVDYHPQQIEFARLNLSYTVTSKRKLNELVGSSHVDGWDDPRMPTIAGIRRRGYTPSAIIDFCKRIGVTKNDTLVDIAILENCVRHDLDRITPRVMVVLRPLRVVIENYSSDKIEWLEAANHPDDPKLGSRRIPFSKTLLIERDDFMEAAPKKFFRLAPGQEVRLRYAYFITCTKVIKNEHGEIIELRCTYDPLSKGGNSPDGRKVRGTIHWLSEAHAMPAEVRLYDRLFNEAQPDNGEHHWCDCLNPESVIVLNDARLEPGLTTAQAGECFQFERLGYFNVDIKDSQIGNPVFNRIVSLRDSWAKQYNKNNNGQPSNS